MTEKREQKQLLREEGEKKHREWTKKNTRNKSITNKWFTYKWSTSVKLKTQDLQCVRLTCIFLWRRATGRLKLLILPMYKIATVFPSISLSHLSRSHSSIRINSHCFIPMIQSIFPATHFVWCFSQIFFCVHSLFAFTRCNWSSTMLPSTLH